LAFLHDSVLPPPDDGNHAAIPFERSMLMTARRFRSDLMHYVDELLKFGLTKRDMELLMVSLRTLVIGDDDIVTTKWLIDHISTVKVHEENIHEYKLFHDKVLDFTDLKSVAIVYYLRGLFHGFRYYNDVFG
jgi:hypothetical protein